MKKMKTLALLALAAMMLFALTALAAAETLQLGTSAYSITVPDGYTLGEMSDEDIHDDLVGYYFSEDSLVDFDVYQWAPDEGETIITVAVDEAEDNMVTAHVINGIGVLCYEAVEESDGFDYDTVTFVFEDGESILELVFWLDGDTAAEEVEAMISTLTK